MKSFLLYAVWGICVLVGFGQTMKWSLEPGKSVAPKVPVSTSRELRIEAIIHPECPCSTASIDLLKRALESTKAQAEICFYFVGKKADTNNVRLARKIPGASLTFISEAESREKFGEASSGQLLIWRQDELLFSGGVTDARGEQAPGAAYKALVSVLSGNAKKTLGLPVYGCPVTTPK